MRQKKNVERKLKEIEKTEKNIQEVFERKNMLSLIKGYIFDVSDQGFKIFRLEFNDYGNLFKSKKKKKEKMKVELARAQAEIFKNSLEMIETLCFTQTENGYGKKAVVKTYVLLICRSIIGYNDTLISTLRWENRNSFDAVAEIIELTKNDLGNEIDKFLGINPIDYYYFYVYNNCTNYLGEILDVVVSKSVVADFYFYNMKEMYTNNVYDKCASSYNCYTLVNIWKLYMYIKNKEESASFFAENYTSVVEVVKRSFPKQLAKIDFDELKIKYMREAMIKIKEYHKNEY